MLEFEVTQELKPNDEILEFILQKSIIVRKYMKEVNFMRCGIYVRVSTD